MEKREISALILAGILLIVLLAFNTYEPSISILLNSIITAIAILTVAVASKKITANYLDEKLEVKIWELQRYGVRKSEHWKNPIPMGIIVSVILSLLSSGFIKFMAILQFDYEALPSKVVKKYGRRRFSNTMEWDGALIAFYSFLSVLGLSLISSIIFSSTALTLFQYLSKYSFYYALYNLIPFSQLDGMKIFMGSKPLFYFSLVVAVILGLIISSNIFF